MIVVGRKAMNVRSIYFSICLALISVVATAYQPAAAAKHAFEDDNMFDGPWRSQGYGWLWQINDGQVARFDIGNSFCIAKSSDEEDMIGPDSRAQISEDGRTLRLLLEDPDYFYTFERLPELPASCSQSPDANPAAIFDVVVEMFGAPLRILPRAGDRLD